LEQCGVKRKNGAGGGGGFEKNMAEVMSFVEGDNGGEGARGEERGGGSKRWGLPSVSYVGKRY